jgi:hypothetical protein
MGGPLTFAICLQMAVRCRLFALELFAQVCAERFSFTHWGKEFAIVEGSLCTIFFLANLHQGPETFFAKVSKEQLVPARFPPRPRQGLRRQFYPPAS